MRSKRALTLLLALCMVLALLPVGALADKSDTDVAYEVTGGSIYFDASTGTITDCDQSVTAANIPEKINDVAVTSIGDKAFSNCESLTGVNIPDGVTSIGSNAFRNCMSLTNVTLPDNVTSIADEAFYACSRLTNINIPDSVTSIGSYAFYKCTSLTSVAIPAGVKSIDVQAFYACSSLTNINIPDSVTSIGTNAFSGCENIKSVYIDSLEAWCALSFDSCDNNPMCYGAALYIKGELATDVTIPSSVTSIDDYAFNGCSSLTNITIPAGVTSIGKGAFDNCESLTNVTIPDSVTSIGAFAFENCTGLTSVTIPDSVTSIGGGAFYGCTGLTSVTIPDSVTSIGGGAFYGCTGLTSVNIPSSVTWIGASAFKGCTNLESVTISDSVTRISSDTFYGCTSLTSMTIPDKITSIDNSAFNGCTSLTSVNIPSSVTSIGYWAFKGCTSLTDVYYGGTIVEWNSIDIDSGNDALTSAGIHCEDPFDDIDGWYHDEICIAYEAGIVNGGDDGKFYPTQNVTREQFITMLYRLDGGDEIWASYELPEPTFADKGSISAYAANAVKWAAACGIVDGRDGNRFAPQATATRAETVTMLYRFFSLVCEGYEYDLSPYNFDHGFTDVNAGDWYAEAVNVMANGGIVNGGDGNNFLPNATTDRAQAACFCVRISLAIYELFGQD